MSLRERIKKELVDFEHHAKAQGIDYVYNQAYYIAFMNELEFLFIEYYDQTEEDEMNFDELYGALVNVDGNICESIMDYYSQFNHPERYNPFMLEDMMEIVEIYIKEHNLRR